MPDIAVRKTTRDGITDRAWVGPGGREGVGLNKTITLDVATFDPDDHYPDGVLHSGLVIGHITSGDDDDLYGIYDNTATDGRQTAVGHLWNDEVVNAGSTQISATLYRSGVVREVNLFINHGLDSAAKADLANNIFYE
jgi:hypothetical protein